MTVPVAPQYFSALHTQMDRQSEHIMPPAAKSGGNKHTSPVTIFGFSA